MALEWTNWAEQRSAVAVQPYAGVAPAIDQLSPLLPASHRFLRAAWFGSPESRGAATLIASRADGSPVSAIPTIGLGPALVGARTVPGSYWPFRAVPIAQDATAEELTAFLEHPVTLATLGQVWRLGPTYADDPATQRLSHAAASAGWTVLVRQLGRTFLFDTTGGWPRASTRRRLANYRRQLDQLGAVRFDTIRGRDWSDAVLAELGAIEQASWVGRATDGTGAKFMSPDRRTDWRRALADPVLADALMATILRVDGTPVAFSFDLIAGALQYGIASSYAESFAAYRPGKLVTAHQIAHACALGVSQIDFGAGDSGYKREMGAAPGSPIVDLLFVRSRTASSLLQLKWGPECDSARQAYRTASLMRHAARSQRSKARVDLLMAMGAVAAAAISFVE